MKPPAPKQRARAYRLRAKLRRGDALETEDATWLNDYEKGTRSDDGPDIGASASSRTIHVEEKRLAVGTGAAAETAAAAAMAREEGRRLDFLTDSAAAALKAGTEALVAAAAQSRAACEVYKGIVVELNSRTQTLEEVHLSMLDAVREQYLARTQAEVDALQKDGKEGLENQLLGALVARMAGGALPKQ